MICCEACRDTIIEKEEFDKLELSLTEFFDDDIHMDQAELEHLKDVFDISAPINLEKRDEYWDHFIDRAYLVNLLNEYKSYLVNGFCPRIITLFSADAHYQNYTIRCNTKIRITTILLILYFQTFYDCVSQQYRPERDTAIYPTLPDAMRNIVHMYFYDKNIKIYYHKQYKLS